MFTGAGSLDGASRQPADHGAGSMAVPAILNLKRALALVLARSPALQGAAAEVAARESERLQAGLLPNPELRTTVENFAGSGRFAATRSAETTVELSQLVQLGGDRSSRVQLATYDRKLAGWDYAARRLDLLTATTERFVDVLAAQRRLDLSRSLLQLARKVESAADNRVAAGKASPLERIRAQILVAQTQSTLAQNKADLQAARQSLASLWGEHRASFQKVVGRFPQQVELPAAATLEPYLQNNPAVARWADEINARRAAVSVAQAKATPDVVVSVGGRRLSETGDNAVVASLSIPLPLFDRQQGAIAAARQRVSEAGYDRQRTENRLQATFSSAYGQLSAAASQLQALRSSILPKAQSVFDATTTGYREGKFDLLHLLDAQRALFDARLSTVDANVRYSKAQTQVEGLIGRSLASVTAGPDTQGRQP